MICPECGSYQPNGIKFCGICGVPLSTDESVSQFFREEIDQGELALPRHRSPLFFLGVFLGILILLALIGGIGYVIYKAVSGKPQGQEIAVEFREENLKGYRNDKLGLSFFYPKLWELEEMEPGREILLKLELRLTSEKLVTISGEMLDPDITLGGIEDIEGHIDELIKKDLGPSIINLPRERGKEEGENKYELTSLTLSGCPAYLFSTEIIAEARRYTVLYYFIVDSDILYILKGTAPTDIWEETSQDFMVVVGTFKIERPEEGKALEEIP